MTLFDNSIECPQKNNTPAFSGSVNLVLNNMKVHGSVDFGVIVAGQFIPPSISEADFFTTLDAAVSGQLILNATLSVSAQPVSLAYVGC